MKNLTSSPYATFNVKEWNSVIRAKNIKGTLKSENIKKKYFGKHIRFELEEVSSQGVNQPSLVQLSFA